MKSETYTESENKAFRDGWLARHKKVMELKEQLKKERELRKELVQFIEQYEFLFDQGGQTRQELNSLIKRAKDAGVI